ncbi:hypothetical protein [Virgibacillus sp. Bac332]|uniref:hypothetical protein n=1 Tax=Virgibacillus sp. Bac332 TaxID=2419842 RepID=UPI000EF46F73|nr:hypothetical protein [Virgibacillus sp. Bac332]
MAHYRKDSSRPSTTISLEKELFEAVDDYKFGKRIDHRSTAIEQLIVYGLKYAALVEKKKAKLAKA